MGTVTIPAALEKLLAELPHSDPRINPAAGENASVPGQPQTPAAIVGVAGLPVTAGDYLNVRGIPFTGPVTVTVSGLLQVGNGPPMQLSQQFTFTNTGTPEDFTISLVTGYLISVTAITSASNLVAGELVLQVWLQRNSAGGATPAALLISDSLLSNQALGWP